MSKSSKSSKSSKLSTKDLVTILDFTPADLEQVFALCAEQKPLAREHRLPHSHPNRTLACIFYKPSLRTRISFEIAIRQLGGSSLYVTNAEIGLGERESIEDVGRVLSRFVDGIMIRTFDHEHVRKLAAESSVPVVNGLTDLTHPCQILADVFTVKEEFGDITGRKVVYVGDGNNIAHSWINAAALMDFPLVIATPRDYAPDENVVAAARAKGSLDLTVSHDPVDAVKGADVVYTDVWASMGQEDEAAARKKAFADFQLNDALISHAKDEAIVLHCLPAHRGLEITDSVMDGPQSRVYDEAENRLHIQRAVLALLMD
ncbi:ornithine carbamoyltransferase [bacterium]|nr:MAG: ornithine carbamoyltransferase [bacterium]